MLPTYLLLVLILWAPLGTIAVQTSLSSNTDVPHRAHINGRFLDLRPILEELSSPGIFGGLITGGNYKWGIYQSGDTLEASLSRTEECSTTHSTRNLGVILRLNDPYHPQHYSLAHVHISCNPNVAEPFILYPSAESSFCYTHSSKYACNLLDDNNGEDDEAEPTDGNSSDNEDELIDPGSGKSPSRRLTAIIVLLSGTSILLIMYFIYNPPQIFTKNPHISSILQKLYHLPLFFFQNKWNKRFRVTEGKLVRWAEEDEIDLMVNELEDGTHVDEYIPLRRGVDSLPMNYGTASG